MSFQYPLGLLGLIGVPIIILIYILKNKYTEQIIASTYLWRLSEKFLTKKKPISLISGIISLILQIIAIVSISLIIAHPIIAVPNAAKEYCFILDASGSMHVEEGGITRFDEGKNEIKEIISSSSDGSLYTLVYAGSSTRVIYEKLDDKEKATELIDKLTLSGMEVNFNSTLKYVQGYFNENPSLVTYLITDRDYSSSNVEIINLSTSEANYRIVEMNVEKLIDKLIITGKVISFNSDEAVNLDIYVNNQKETTLSLQTQSFSETSFTYESSSVNYDSVTAKITNEDKLSLDDTYVVYNLEKRHSYKTLIISDSPFYIASAIETVGNTSYSWVKPENYNSEITGYDLYIFDAYSPSVLPNDGTVWLFGITQSIEGSGFSVQDVIENEDGMMLTYPKNSTSIYKTLTQGLLKDTIYVSKFVKYGIYRNFTILQSFEGSPAIFTGTSENGCREVVFAFDLHDSNFPLSLDYLTLTKNLLDYSFPVALDQANYTCGEMVNINVLSNCDSIRVTTPSGNVSYLDVSSEVAEFKTEEVGTYSILMMLGDNEKELLVYSHLSESESFTSVEDKVFSLQGDLQNEYRDGIYDKLIVIFIILAIIYVADWMVYCYEQYQLR